MNLIEFLREKLTASVIEKISSFLGESPENTETAMQATLPTILGGLVQQGTTDDGAKKIMDIIKDGGHTGDILNNLSGLLDNFDKLQLLITIGTNIFNHFFGNTSSILIDKVANLSSLKNSSSSSLLGLTAPMVLGAIGYVVQKENLGISGLKNLLNDQRENVSKALPSIIAPHLPLRSISPIQEEEPIIATPVAEKVSKTPKVEALKSDKDKSVISNLLPWIFLVVLALVSFYYLRSCRTNIDEKSPSSLMETDSLTTDGMTGIIDDSSEISDDIDTNEQYNPTPKKNATTNTDQPLKNSNRNRDSPARSTSSNQSTAAERSSGSLLNAQTLRNSRSWVSVSSNSFGSNNAEIRNSDEINAISAYLQQNPTATVSIAPTGSGRVAEDRAYAVREQLYQKGIAISRILMASPRNDNGGVSIKLNR